MKVPYTYLPDFIAAVTLLFVCSTVMAVSEDSAAATDNLAQPATRVFSIYDFNHNGYLERDEYRQLLGQIEQHGAAARRHGGRKPMPLRYEEIDVNDDGRISEDEMITALNKRLKKQRRYRYRGGDI